MFSHPLYVVAVLAACVALAEFLARRTVARYLGTALVVIVLAAVAANLGTIPTSAESHPVYDLLFKEVAWMAIFCLLLRVNLRQILRAGPQMLILFVLAAVGTLLGVIVGMKVVGGEEAFGVWHRVLAGMFTGTYTGGSANFVAIASHYEFKDGVLLAAANAVDSGMTTVWMAATLAVPKLLKRGRGAAPTADFRDRLGVVADTEPVHPVDLGIVIAGAAGAVWGSELLAVELAALGFAVPPILVLTTLALVLAQIPAVGRLRGTRLLGMFGVYMFLAVIGALCDLDSLLASGHLGLSLLIFVSILLLVHGLVVFGAARLFRLDVDTAAVASQANIGGGTTALALARSLGRPDLVLPGILMGALGTAVGTYLGLWVAGF